MRTTGMFYVALDIWASVIGLIIIILASKDVYRFEAMFGRLWRTLIIANILVICDAAMYLLGDSDTQIGALFYRLCQFLTYFLSGFINWLFVYNVNFIIHKKEKIVWNRYLWISTISIGIYMVGLVVHYIVRHLDSEQMHVIVSHRLYSLIASIPPTICLLACVVNIVVHKKVLSERILRTFVASLLIIVVCVCVQIICYELHMTNLAIEFVTVLVFIEYWVDRRERIINEKSETFETWIKNHK